MMILQAWGTRQGFGPLWRAQAQVRAQVFAQVHAFLLMRLVSFNRGDLRWTVAALSLRLFGVALAFVERQLAIWAMAILKRAWQGARFAARPDDADTMVAAGRR